jgi:uncharacterized membrane-anchored protein YjiN (DUF445 family)
MYIGGKKIKEAKPAEKTSNGIEVVDVVYTDNSVETLSKLMYDKITSEKSCDLTTLRERRMEPVVQEMLAVLMKWGIKTSELQYMSVLLNTSLQESEKEAIKELWLPLIPNLKDIEDVDLIAVDKVLRAKKDKSVPSPYGK